MASVSNTASSPAPDSSQHSTSSDNVLSEMQWATGGQKMAAVNYSEKVLEEKERRLVESIHRNYGRIREVERELAALQLQLRMNVGPKKQALELLRRKIEVQNERVKAAVVRRDATKKAYEEAAEALASEERAKEQLCQELNLLVQQSATAQLDKLEELNTRLQMLNEGISVAEEAAHQAERAAPGSTLRSHATSGAANGAGPAPQQQQQQPAEAPVHDPTNPFLAAAPGGQQAAPQPQATPEEIAAQRQRAQQAEEERRRAQARAEAEAARSRHVSLGGRGAGARGASQKQQQQATGQPRAQGRTPTAVHAAAEGVPELPRVATDERGAFRGFE